MIRPTRLVPPRVRRTTMDCIRRLCFSRSLCPLRDGRHHRTRSWHTRGPSRTRQASFPVYRGTSHFLRTSITRRQRALISSSRLKETDRGLFPPTGTRRLRRHTSLKRRHLIQARRQSMTAADKSLVPSLWFLPRTTTGAPTTGSLRLAMNKTLRGTLNVLFGGQDHKVFTAVFSFTIFWEECVSGFFS
jgi:hypothetical protein